MDKIYITKSGNETMKLGEAFAKTLKPGEIVCLYGNLGGGKTTFVKGVAEGFGIKERIISPTFIVVRQHDIKQGKIRRLFHVDLYRLGEGEALSLGLKDIIEDDQAIILIEWAKKADKLLSSKKISKVFFKDLGEEKREIKIVKDE